MRLVRRIGRRRLRINLGCGAWKLDGFVNVDADATVEPDVCSDATTYLQSLENGSAREFYLGHFLEHLERDEGLRLLREIHRALERGGKVGVVVPDTREIMRRVCAGDLDLDEACHYYLYSTVQASRHRWSYDEHTLSRVLREAGFAVLRGIDRWSDPRLAGGVWWQCGVDAVKPQRAGSQSPLNTSP